MKLNYNTKFLPNLEPGTRVWCNRVEVRETDASMTMRVGHREDGEFNV